MEWLHFSDFHFEKAIGPQNEAMICLLDFISKEMISHPGQIDAIFLVGDIAYSGHQTEYERFENDFLSPLLKIPGLSDAKIYAVPGNHDVDCNATTPITWDSIGGRNQPIYFSENEDGQKIRIGRNIVFKEYQEFVKRNRIISPDPFKEVSIFVEEPAFPFDIVALNTSFFCDKDENSDEANVPCPLSSLRDRLKGNPRTRPVVILGHHPSSLFLKDQQKPFVTLLMEKDAVYLHGHEHDPNVTTNVDGTLRTLGFGATYIAPLGTAAHAPYRNSFARCRLDQTLHLKGYSWDYHNGKWDDTTKSQFATCIKGEHFDGNSVILKIPLLNEAKSSKSQTPSLQSIPRKTPEPNSIIPISLQGESVWLKLLALSKNIKTNYSAGATQDIQSSKVNDGKSEIVTENANMRDLLICIPGPTHILSSKEIESYNTRLDLEDFRSVTVLSFGKLSPEAKDMYSRLKSKKPIEVLANNDITQKWQQILSVQQINILSNCDSGSDTATILISGEEVYLLIISKRVDPSFRIIETSGATLPPTHEVVSVLRANNSSFEKLPYTNEPSNTSEFPNLMDFDESGYLKKCHSEYNSIKYAALANIGIRFSDFSLEDLYINASAREMETAQSTRIDDVLDDHLAVYPVSENLKSQIKQQIRNQVDGQERHETAQAREFCQKFGAVLLTGDPGSGKTCFVKSEILSYCKREHPDQKATESEADWHSIHIPVMVPLSQAAAEPDLETLGLLPIASRLLERRGFNLPAHKITDLLKEGRLALFFDGLDEVVSVEKRALVVQHINEIVTHSLSLGNRVVVTSRPAAINVVNLLPALHQLELQGLTQDEIRQLTNKILTLRLSDSAEGVVIDNKELSQSDNLITRQLLADCEEKPGVARFATNPLLLTLLVMIYANSGAPSAKRHRIYEEAIKTLASVRGRQAGHYPVSVQDLRERLGAVALSVYRKESGFLPTLSEVTEIVRCVMSRQQGSDVSSIDAQRFIQKVAESTGLIAVGGAEGKRDDAGVVTFMHHSFMEYFAAVGLSKDLDNYDVKALVAQPRWMEILTLLSGIIGENSDIAPILARFVDDGSNFGSVDARYLIFALDCALECEVPSEAAIRLLACSITKCAENGPARSDPWVRSEIGHRLSQLVGACGIIAFESTMASLIRSKICEVSAAGIAISGYSFSDGVTPTEILKAIEESCSRPEEGILCAVCDIATKTEWSRTPIVMQVIARCLKKTPRCKRAAFEAISSITGLAVKHWPEIINGLDDTDLSVKRVASKAAIQAGLDSDVAALSDTRKDLVVNAMRYASESQAIQDLPGSQVSLETVQRLLQSPYLRDRIIGIQLIPVAERDGNSAYRTLINIVNNTQDNQEMTAALRVFRSSYESRLLISMGDLRKISELCKNGTSDVRRAGIQLLGCFGADVPPLRFLIEQVKSVSSHEFEAVLSSLARAQVLQDEIVGVIEEELLKRLRSEGRMDEDYIVEMCALHDAARILSKNVRPQVSNAMQTIVGDFKHDERVRRSALRAYAATAVPSKQAVEYLTGLFVSPPLKMIVELVQSLRAFAVNCRQSIESVMACVEALSALRREAMSLHEKFSKKDVTADNEAIVTELRDGIHEVSQIIVTFEEFILPSQTLTLPEG